MTSKTAPFFLTTPSRGRRPILVSCPHSGTEIPTEVAQYLTPNARAVPDTDFFVHELYGFAASLGVTLIRARYSRYVVDLNRDPVGRKLYADGRAETGLTPVRSFAQESLYVRPEDEPGDDEIKRRLTLYYDPYHQAVRATLATLYAEFPEGVLLYEAHSIKRLVPSINPAPFSDMIVGDQKGRTCAPALSDTALAGLRKGGFDVEHNTPFMGGYLTRSFGKPETGIHALQVEMAQDVYMDETRNARDLRKLGPVQETLVSVLDELAKVLERGLA